ncbi:MAG: YncE family protein [Archangiaceae bacterium]|nr:YncE family protein [Archangiaceae bacterium]
MKLREQLLLVGALLLSASVAFAHDDDDDDDGHGHHRKKTYILATGRRDPRMFAISLDEAIKPANQLTENAIVSRSKVALDRLDGRPLGDSANVVVSEDQKTLYVVNHHGSIDNAEFNQHGGRANLALLNIKKMIDPRNNNTAAALERHIDSGWFGGVGLVLLPDMFVMGAAENHLTEDGANRMMFIDRKTGSLRGMAELALPVGRPTCPIAPDWPVPFVSPHGPPTPVPLLSPNPGFGCFPDTNGIVVGYTSAGKPYIFGANGGTDDVSVVDLQSALAGNKTPEVAKIPTQVGPWGIAITPDKKTVIAANRESARVAFEGNTISFINVDLAAAGSPGAEVARVLVGTSDPNVQTRPFIPSVTPDGKYVVVPCFRSNNVSIVDIAKALAGDPGYEVARIPLTRVAESTGSVLPARPKGSAITADGRYAVISAGGRTAEALAPSGYVYVIDLQTRTVVGTVKGIGNDPYGITVTEQ